MRKDSRVPFQDVESENTDGDDSDEDEDTDGYDSDEDNEEG